MIGLRTGDVSGFWVLDLDAKKNTGEELLAAVRAFCGGALSEPDPATGEIFDPPMVKTQSGGFHLYFAMPADGTPLGNRAKLFDKTDSDPILHGVVETRGTGGYVIAPPSVMRTGGRYQWIARDAKAPPPQANRRLLDLVLRRGEFSRDATGDGALPLSGEAASNPPASISERAAAGGQPARAGQGEAPFRGQQARRRKRRRLCRALLRRGGRREGACHAASYQLGPQRGAQQDRLCDR